MQRPGGAVRGGRARERAFLDDYVAVRAGLCGFSGFVAEPEGDHGDTDARVQERHRRAVPQGVRGDVLVGQGRAGCCGGPGVLGDEALDGAPAGRGAAAGP